jgi:putative ATP-binding cassette transporter
VALPNGRLLLANTSLIAAAGARVLLQGPSGSGKSTLFRTLAGIWPFAEGQLARPAKTMFIPQRPYFPDGPLRDALAYPEPATRYSDDELRQALTAAELAPLGQQLDQTRAWGQTLSGGEQQRLAIARVLLKKPQWVFADEATSALDEATDSLLYHRLLALVAEQGGGLVSIGHRPALAAFHDSQWLLQAQPAGSQAAFSLKAQAT